MTMISMIIKLIMMIITMMIMLIMMRLVITIILHDYLSYDYIEDDCDDG